MMTLLVVADPLWLVDVGGFILSSLPYASPLQSSIRSVDERRAEKCASQFLVPLMVDSNLGCTVIWLDQPVTEWRSI